MTRTILVLAANPKDTPRLRLDQEVREIDNGLQRAQRREELFILEQKWATRPVDVRRAVLDFRPQIVHFCGHGGEEKGIAFEDETGHTKLVGADALGEFFELFADSVECVVLNACYSEIQAEAIAQYIDYVIGMNEEIGDAAAIEFAVAFYDALGAGESIEFAYKLACNAIRWSGVPEHLTPVLLKGGGGMETESAASEGLSIQTVSSISAPTVQLSINRVWPIPRYYATPGFNIVLLHPSELEIIKRTFNLAELNQVTVLYRPDLLKPDGLVKELIGPFEVYNLRTGKKVSTVYATSTVPEYEYDFGINRNSISMSLRLMQELDLETTGRVEMKLVPESELLFSSQLEIYHGYPIDRSYYYEGEEEEEEEEEEEFTFSEEEMRAITLKDVLPLELASHVLTEQSATRLTLTRKISAHEHYRLGCNIDLFIRAMDATGIAKAVFVPTGEKPDNRGYEQNMQDLLETQRRYPDRIIAFATVNESDPNAPQIFEHAVKEGAQGLKLIGGHPDFYVELLNSRNVCRIIEMCERFSLPVLIHVSLLKHPKIAAEFQDLLTKFPNVTFIAAHYGKFAPELHRMADLLRSFSNLHTDISMGRGLYRYIALIHNEPDRFREFIIQYQDRILWGTDSILSREDNLKYVRARIEIDLHLLSREMYISPLLSRVIPVRGLNLPKPVLAKIFWENPQRILNIATKP